MTLQQYIASRSQPLTQEDVARAIGRHKSTISRVLAGKGCSRRLARDIEAWSGGLVSAAEVLLAQVDDDTHGRCRSALHVKQKPASAGV
jgi:DNA-directed RNA polymerase specialized sigma54-like protein